MNKKFLIIGSVTLGLLILAIGSFFYFNNPNNPEVKNNKESQPTVDQPKAEKVVFTHKIFDPADAEYITPLGELNGGYHEVQTIGGVMIDIAAGKEMEVYAPTDMELVQYAHYIMDGETVSDWTLYFRINSDVKLSIGHLNNAGKKIIDVVGDNPKANDSRSTDLKTPLEFKAGELIGTTSGTSQAHNWNVYMYDINNVNEFVNQERYENNYMGQDLIAAVCPFDYYQDETVKSAFLSLMGATAPGQSSTCGNPSKDVRGTLSGMWHLNQTGIESAYDGQYANPFSIYKRSGGDIILFEIGKERRIIKSDNSTYKDPAEIKTSHCYALTEDFSKKKAGYAYFNILSDTEMTVAYKNTGACPSTFPTGSAKKYYR